MKKLLFFNGKDNSPGKVKSLTKRDYKELVDKQGQTISKLLQRVEELEQREKELKSRVDMFVRIFMNDGFSVKKISYNDLGLVFMVITKIDVSKIFELKIFHCWGYPYCVASALYKVMPDHIQLESVHTVIGYERKGYGRELLEEIINVAREENKDILGQGRVREGEVKDAKNFFEKRGFHVQYNEKVWAISIKLDIASFLLK